MTGMLVDQVSFINTPESDLNPWSIFTYRDPRRIGPLISEGMALDRHIRRAGRANAEQHHAGRHVDMALFAMSDDCGHFDPCDLDEGIDDLVDAEHERRHPGDIWSKSGHHERKKATRALFMQAVLLDLMDNAYHDEHGRVCGLTPMGGVCTACAEDDEEGSDDFGYEPSACHRQETARESYDEFWETQGAEWNRPPTLVSAR